MLTLGHAPIATYSQVDLPDRPRAKPRPCSCRPSLVPREPFASRPLLVRAGLHRIHFHDLRHSTATLLLSLGVPPKIVQEFLGHVHISITMDLYSHSMPTLQQEAMAKLGLLLAPAPGSR
jgi:hypothetical protein